MIKAIMRALACLSLLAMLGPVDGVAQPTMHFTIPFNFTAGQKYFPSGNYEVWELNHNTLAIRSEDGRVSTLVLATRDEPGKLPGTSVMTFNQYGERYFLFRVADYDHGLRLGQSAVERQLIAGRTPPKKLAIVASSGK